MFKVKAFFLVQAVNEGQMSIEDYKDFGQPLRITTLQRVNVYICIPILGIHEICNIKELFTLHKCLIV